MIVYDCDDPDQFRRLNVAVGDLLLDVRNHLQSFGPDTIHEALNRGFKAGSSEHE